MRGLSSRCYVRPMRVTWPVPYLGNVVDIGVAVAGVGLIVAAEWAPVSVTGTDVPGPDWLRAVLPVLIGLPLVLRRRAPLVMWAVIWAGVLLQAAITWNSLPSHGLELIFALFAGAYSVAAYSPLRRALIGLLIMAPGAAVYVLANRGWTLPAQQLTVMRGPASGAEFFIAEILICWLGGVLVRARRDSAALSRRNAALAAEAELAVAVERTRIARELHDIVAHHLSVVIVQAAGARASGKPAGGSLEKIEHSGRQALTELRRLVGVLREQHDEPELAPQPGMGELPALADTIRAAGVPVHLVVDAAIGDGGPTPLPAAVEVSAYRIVQEALTNVLKHAGPARAEVLIGRADDIMTIQVTDDGGGLPAEPASGGHGLVGMRERVALFGGGFQAGPRPGGGFAVRATLPLAGSVP
jgi:signal transduction histidine kinase